MIDGILKNCPDCREIKCSCPKTIGQKIKFNFEEFKSNTYYDCDRCGKVCRYPSQVVKYVNCNICEKCDKVRKFDRDYPILTTN